MTEDGFTCITIPIPGFLDPSLEGNLRLAPSPGISLLVGDSRMYKFLNYPIICK
jgi:hypothetical protein